MAKSPGDKVRGSSTGRPIMVLLDMLGQRWTLRILWELGEARVNFRVLRLKCDDMSPTVLNKRLKDLRAMGLVDLDDWGFGLTQQGKALARHLVGLDVWASEWATGLETAISPDTASNLRVLYSRNQQKMSVNGSPLPRSGQGYRI